MMTVKRTVVTGDRQMTLNPRDVHMRIGGIFGGYRFDERELRGFRDSDALREYIESHCTAENLMREFIEVHGVGETAEYIGSNDYQQMLYHWMDKEVYSAFDEAHYGHGISSMFDKLSLEEVATD